METRTKAKERQEEVFLISFSTSERLEIGSKIFRHDTLTEASGLRTGEIADDLVLNRQYKAIVKYLIRKDRPKVMSLSSIVVYPPPTTLKDRIENNHRELIILTRYIIEREGLIIDPNAELDWLRELLEKKNV
jgi:hypothetical protein